MISFSILASVSTVFAAYTAGKFSFNATASSSNVTTVCISGPVSVNQYIGFGIPASPSNPIMAGADLTLVFASSTNVPSLITGSGNGNPGLTVQATTAKINTGLSSYSNGVLIACVDRPTSAWLTNSPSSFLWSTGQISGGVAQQHAPTDRGSLTNVNIFSTPSVATSVTQNPVTLAATTGSKTSKGTLSARLSFLPALALLKIIFFS